MKKDRKPRGTLRVCGFKNCSAVFNRPSRLECHERSHTGERPFVCPHEDCVKSYARATYLKRHEAVHLEKKYKCKYEGCEVMLKTAATLKKHIDYMHKHKKPKTYKCSHCGKEFSKHCELTAHEYEHTKILPYVCPEKGCGKRFRVPSKLKRHSKIHKGYKCDRESCSKVLPTWSLFRKHIKLEHSYKCSTCGRVLSSASNLQAHETTHVIPDNRTVLKCPKENCPRFYFATRNLTHHIKNYHDKRPFKCTSEGCYRCFKVEAYLKKHERFHNPNLPLPSKKKKKTKPTPTIAHKLSGLSVKDAKKCEALLVADTSIPDDAENTETSMPDDVKNADTSVPDDAI